MNNHYTLPLRDALARVTEATGREFSTYEVKWIFRNLADQGKPCGIYVLPGLLVLKTGGRWKVDPEQLEWLIPIYLKDQEWKLAQAEIERAKAARQASDYAKHILHSEGGTTDKGKHYTVSGDFHCVNSEYMDNGRWESLHTWICNNCWQRATEEHNKPECHRCSDWSPCGCDCTLSAIVCIPCGNKLEIWKSAS